MALRRDTFGFIFQRYNLMSDLNAVENAEVPAVHHGMAKAQRAEHASGLLRELGLGNRLEHFPSQRSGGQQQRVSIGRALMNGGPVILADEPTGALDKPGWPSWSVRLASRRWRSIFEGVLAAHRGRADAAGVE